MSERISRDEGQSPQELRDAAVKASWDALNIVVTPIIVDGEIVEYTESEA